MQRKSLLISLSWLCATMQTASTQCTVEDVECTEYIVKSKRCLNLSGCANHGMDTTSVVWYRCERTLPSANGSVCRRRSALAGASNDPLYVTDGRLCFRELKTTYSGLYCYETVENSTCLPVQVIIVEKPAITAVSNVTMITGGIAEQNTAILQCDRPVEGCPVKIQWKHEKHILSSNSHFTIITTANFTKLIISNVSINDNGLYQCEAVDEYEGMVYTEQIHLTVSTAVTQEINASLCSNPQLTCDDVINNPYPQYQWTHNNGTVTATTNGSLNLFKVKPSDFGMYYCWLKPSPYGTVVTQLLLMQQAAVPVISEYVFLLIHHQNIPLMNIKQITSSLELYVSNLCGCCDVTIVMELLWPCQCSNSTGVYAFKLNGSQAMTLYELLMEQRTTVHEGNLTFSICNSNCCELCDNRATTRHEHNRTDPELALIVTMAALIAVLFIMMVIILLSYQWYRSKVQITENEKVHVVPVTNHVNSINGQAQSSINDTDYDKLVHHNNNNNTCRTNISYESLS